MGERGRETEIGEKRGRRGKKGVGNEAGERASEREREREMYRERMEGGGNEEKGS